MTSEIRNRKGARKFTDIPKNVLELLNKGEIESVNLTEWLAIDHVELIETNFKNIGISKTVIDTISAAIKTQKKPSTMNSTKLIGALLYESYKDDKNYASVLKNLSSHTSDAIRCYAPYLIALNEKLNLEEKLEQSKPLIADAHFGIREVVWMALRPEINNNLTESIEILSSWTTNTNENIRRFTTEATRPRGVWCKHIEELKAQPQLALPILEPLKSDEAKYVQDSVANWLNDASKTQPQFVIEVCKKWTKESPTKSTEKIVKRALRTLNKN